MHSIRDYEKELKGFCLNESNHKFQAPYQDDLDAETPEK